MEDRKKEREKVNKVRKQESQTGKVIVNICLAKVTNQIKQNLFDANPSTCIVLNKPLLINSHTHEPYKNVALIA